MNEPTLLPVEALSDDCRGRVVLAAAALIASGGPDAATTRAVAVAAGVQAPTIYRLFGDKRGLLDAVAEHGLATYVAQKSVHEPNSDPVQELREGWDLHVAFGLAHPGLFAIMSDYAFPHTRPLSPGAAAGLNVLRRKMKVVALAGRLRMSEERAVDLMHSVCTGTVLTLLRKPEQRRDAGLSATARETVITAITGEAPSVADTALRAAATTLRAALGQSTLLSRGENQLMLELLDRIANGA